MEFRPGIIRFAPHARGPVRGGDQGDPGNVAATMGLALVTSLVCLVPATALGAWVASKDTTSLEAREIGGLGLLGTYLPGVGSLISSIALTGFLAYVIGQAVLGHKVGIGETWDGTKRRLPAVAGAVLLTLVGAVVLLGVLLAPPTSPGSWPRGGERCAAGAPAGRGTRGRPALPLALDPVRLRDRGHRARGPWRHRRVRAVLAAHRRGTVLAKISASDCSPRSSSASPPSSSPSRSRSWG